MMSISGNAAGRVTSDIDFKGGSMDGECVLYYCVPRPGSHSMCRYLEGQYTTVYSPFMEFPP